MKCLLKLAKALRATIEEVNLENLLHEIHLFFEATGSAGVLGDNQKMAIKTVKTLLNEIVKLQGPKTLSHIGLIPDTHPTPTIRTFIAAILNANGEDVDIEQILPPPLLKASSLKSRNP